MDSLWGAIIEFNDVRKPETIIEEQFEILSNKTDEAVIGRIEKFNKRFEELSASPVETAVDRMKMITDPPAQELLGEPMFMDDLTFEVFLTAKSIPNYKYRFIFLQHGLAPYPCKLIIEDAIALEIKSEKSIIFCDSENKFIEILKKILSSNRVMTIVSGLASY